MGLRDKERSEYERQVALIADFRDMLINSPQGQRALRHLEDRFHVHSSTATVDLQGRALAAVDRDTQLFNEGQRSVVLYMKGMAEADSRALEADFKEKEVEAGRLADDDIGV